ncbi:calcium-binding protein [Mesorhizobium sp. WSM1497]|uniref:calcium-binding protein n=1 Tax=Mesorhizobium sp. WSM1497 TaxID=278153 RepID=UPI0007ECA589|nr:calcium-binding protein [Mesorhizobium sp. WSM1497]ARP63388.1 calcium-binding protein [Mesorhizobium sp. WSM1497]
MRPNLGICIGVALALSGCGADYLNNYDSVTLAAGDANRANTLAQTVDPFNPSSRNTHIEGNGQRIAGVVQRYRGVAPASGTVPNSGGDLDCAGGKGNNPVVPPNTPISGPDVNGLDRNHDGIGCNSR